MLNLKNTEQETEILATEILKLFSILEITNGEHGNTITACAVHLACYLRNHYYSIH